MYKSFHGIINANKETFCKSVLILMYSVGLQGDREDCQTGCPVAKCGILSWSSQHRQHEHLGPHYRLRPFWLHGQVCLSVQKLCIKLHNANNILEMQPNCILKEVVL